MTLLIISTCALLVCFSHFEALSVPPETRDDPLGGGSEPDTSGGPSAGSKKHYQLVTKKRNWNSAARYCETQFNGHLAAILSAQEQKDVESHLTNAKCKQQEIVLIVTNPMYTPRALSTPTRAMRLSMCGYLPIAPILHGNGDMEPQKFYGHDPDLS